MSCNICSICSDICKIDDILIGTVHSVAKKMSSEVEISVQIAVVSDQKPFIERNQLLNRVIGSVRHAHI